MKSYPDTARLDLPPATVEYVFEAVLPYPPLTVE
jgi:hypothetical protein